ALAGACVTIYCALPLAVGTVHAQQCRYLPKAAAMHGFVGAGVLGSALYLAYPAAGPRYLFGSAFPLQLPPLAAIPAVPAPIAPAFLNAMPSLHMTWALLLYFGSRTLPPPLRLASTGFAVLTALATLGMGEHYLVDLALAFPLALLVHELGHARRPRVVGASLLALTTWLGYLRWGVPLFASVGLWHWPALLATAWLALRAGISANPQSMSMPTTIPPTNSHLQA
ncbi:MAG TPA: phosphatase PAP2 family protein, partial [Rhodocyclaceae bacterium]|nr:phosphatase PAP2 family protein [Rhodocyclaceae bacterium]